MNSVAGAGFVGLGMGLGLLSVIAWLLARRPAPIYERIAPFVGDSIWQPRPSAFHMLRVLGPWGRRRRVEGAAVDGLVWASVGAAVGLLCGILTTATGGSPLALVVMCGLGGGAGWLIQGQVATVSRRRRHRQIVDQVPDVAELLAFAVAAGEPVVSALARVVTSLRGPLVRELEETCSDIRLGASLESALAGLKGRCHTESLDQLVDSLVVAIERGTPLASVLRAQAADARARQRQRLMELAGRKDAAMLVPVVFLVLPIVVVIALFPGLQGLHLIVP